MSKVATQPLSDEVQSQPAVFVAKQERALDIKEALAEYAAVLRKLAVHKQTQENLKSVIRELLKKEPGETHRTNEGVTAKFRVQQRSTINKSLAMEICGSRWSEVERFTPCTSLVINVPGVKGD